MHCPECGAAINPSDKFCFSCGAGLDQSAQAPEAPEKKCPRCGKPADEGDKFCAYCGTAVTETRTKKEKPEKRPTGPLPTLLGTACLIAGFALMVTGRLVRASRNPQVWFFGEVLTAGALLFWTGSIIFGGHLWWRKDQKAKTKGKALVFLSTVLLLFTITISYLIDY